VWYDDYNKFFSGPDRLILRQFYGSETTITNPRRKSTLLGTKLKDIQEYLDSLDRYDPKTAQVVILTAYSTWHQRTLMAEEAPANTDRKGKGKAPLEVDDLEDDFEPDDEGEATLKDPTMIYNSALAECFGSGYSTTEPLFDLEVSVAKQAFNSSRR
jgi:hypothetical protein